MGDAGGSRQSTPIWRAVLNEDCQDTEGSFYPVREHPGDIERMSKLAGAQLASARHMALRYEQHISGYQATDPGEHVEHRRRVCTSRENEPPGTLNPSTPVVALPACFTSRQRSQSSRRVLSANYAPPPAPLPPK